MRIVLDARWYGAAAVGGIGRATEQLIAGLQRYPTADEYIALVRPGAPMLPTHPQWRTVMIPWRWYSWAEQLHLPPLLRRLQPDLVHWPHFNVPVAYAGPYVVTIHDLLLQQFPARRPGWRASSRYWVKQLAYRWVCHHAVNHAAAVITDSVTVRDQLQRRYAIPPARITVIAPAPMPMPAVTDDTAVLLRYTITRPFIVYVGNAYPHKNIAGLLAAFARMARHWPGQLVLAGPASDWTGRLAAQVAAAGLNTERVRILSSLPDGDLAALYRTAAVLAQPSLAEGFGLTGLEAMAAQCPVVCNDLPVFHEVYGSAARYAPATDAAAFATALVAVVTQPAEAAALRAAGIERVKHYSADSAAAAHATLYHACQKNKSNQTKNHSTH